MHQRHGVNRDRMKSRNRGLVLQVICTSPHISRSDITKQVGLTKMAVTNIVGELIQEGYIRETAVLDTALVGRNPVLLDLAPSSPVLVGVYLSREDLTVIVTDLKLRTMYKQRQPLWQETGESITQKLYCLVDQALEAAGTRPILGIGISAIGPLDRQAGMLLGPTEFFGIHEYPIGPLLRQRYGIPTYMDNDMNAAALGEKLFGQGKTMDNFLYVGITHGIGAGIITNGRLYQDGSGFAGELGHTSICYNGPLCSCGNRGCLEVYATMPVILGALKKAAGRPVACEEFQTLADDPACIPVFEEISDHLGVALVNVANLLDPQCILLGHQGGYWPRRYMERLERFVNNGILARGHRAIRVEPAAFGIDAPLMGSACLVASELFEGRLSQDSV